MERIQERSLKILHNDYTSNYQMLLEKAGTTTLLIRRLRLLAICVFKSIHSVNPAYLNNLYELKTSNYEMRNVASLVQPKVRTTHYGLRSARYVGSKIWNILPNHFKEMVDLQSFKNIISTWEGPNDNDSYSYYI